MKRTLSIAGLARRGWTPHLIRQFAPDPIATARGPTYEFVLIEQIEGTPEFQAARAAMLTRREAARVVGAAQRKRIANWAESLEIRVPVMEWKTLITKACEQYNARKPRRRPAAAPNGDPSFLARICVNFLRHELTCYHAALKEMSGRLGADDAVAILRRRILDAIAAAYPDLRPECDAKQWRYEEDEATVLPYPPKRRRRRSHRVRK